VLLAPLALAALTLTAACGSDDSGSSRGGSDDGAVSVSDVWVREPAEGAPATAAYGVITNDTDHTVTLVGASSPVSDDVQLHETLMADDGAMSMQAREGGFPIESGDSFTLEPGGAHVMLLDVDPANITDPVEITFQFDGADPVTASATVQPLDEAEVMDEMDDMDHGDTDMGDMEDGTSDTTG
jgi:periplasmic copper chaperone A